MHTPNDLAQRAEALQRDLLGNPGLSAPLQREPSLGPPVDPADNRSRAVSPSLGARHFDHIVLDDPISKERTSISSPPPVEEVALSLVDLRSSVALTSFGAFSLNEMELAGVCRIVLEAVARRMNETINRIRENTGVEELDRRTNEKLQQMLAAQRQEEAKTATASRKPKPVEVEAEWIDMEDLDTEKFDKKEVNRLRQEVKDKSAKNK